MVSFSTAFESWNEKFVRAALHMHSDSLENRDTWSQQLACSLVKMVCLKKKMRIRTRIDLLRQINFTQFEYDPQIL